MVEIPAIKEIKTCKKRETNTCRPSGGNNISLPKDYYAFLNPGLQGATFNSTNKNSKNIYLPEDKKHRRFENSRNKMAKLRKTLVYAMSEP